MTPSTTLPRRHLLAASAAALSAAGLASWTGAAQAQATAAAAPKPLPGYAGWKAGNALIVHSSSTPRPGRATGLGGEEPAPFA